MSADIISQRLQFMKLDPEAQRNLQATKSIVMRELPGALDSFYLQVRAFAETAKFFSGESQIAGAKTRQVAHWDMISSGRFDSSYVQAVTTIGEIHAKIGLEPRWYIGGYALVLETLVAKVIAEKWPQKRGFGAPKGPTSQEVAAQLGALVKATMLDMDLAISVYLREAEAARRKSEEATLAQERKAVSTSIGSAISSLSEGDLTHRLSDDIPAEYMQLRDDFNESMERLQQTMLAINANAHMIQAGTDQIKANTDDLSRRAGRQAASLEETAATLDEITATVKGTADGANHAREVVTVATNEAEKGGNVVREATSAMARIEESSHKIGQIIGVIDEIAFKTNLLALNAGVEAARAGEAGRGFAVVASEVRGLAQRSAEAAKEIKALISTSTSEVDQGVHLVEETGRALRLISEQISEINRVVGNIATSAQEQASGLHQVNIAVNEMDKLTQQNAAMVEESTAAAHTLSTETEELGRLIGHFRVGEKADAAPQRSTKTAPSAKPQAARPALKTFGGGGAARKPAREAAANEWEEF